ncbi:MAG: hypothetical protein NC900_06105, partial [Candidatus Omnitrophica bacterium]|nr:hypothetical protein [Candidatus Omnitrophota bacterium]
NFSSLSRYLWAKFSPQHLKNFAFVFGELKAGRAKSEKAKLRQDKRGFLNTNIYAMRTAQRKRPRRFRRWVGRQQN